MITFVKKKKKKRKINHRKYIKICSVQVAFSKLGSKNYELLSVN